MPMFEVKFDEDHDNKTVVVSADYFVRGSSWITFYVATPGGEAKSIAMYRVLDVESVQPRPTDRDADDRRPPAKTCGPAA